MCWRDGQSDEGLEFVEVGYRRLSVEENLEGILGEGSIEIGDPGGVDGFENLLFPRLITE